jgi:hypothetical protein
MNTLFRGRKLVVILITLLLLTVSACASSTKGLKNDGYQSHPGGSGHPWDKGRSF